MRKVKSLAKLRKEAEHENQLGLCFSGGFYFVREMYPTAGVEIEIINREGFLTNNNWIYLEEWFEDSTGNI